MPVPPTLALGIQALGEAIQLTPISPLQAILTTSRTILQIVDADRKEDQERQRLAKQVLDVAVAFSEGMKKCEGFESSGSFGKLKGLSSDLFRSLEAVKATLLAQPRRGLFTRIFGKPARAKTLKACEDDLYHISSLFDTQLKLINAKLVDSITSESRTNERESAIEESLSGAHQEILDLVRSQVYEESRRKLQRSSFGHLPPAASPVFFGRTSLVSQLVESLVNVPAYHCILGPGGIGKTSVALNVLHDPHIVEVYGKHRYFLACETTADASGIIAGIADIFSLDEASFIKSFKRLCETIESNILFLLDNFETPWERMEARQKVEELLAQLSGIPNLSILVTLRGAERPYGILWSRPHCPILGPLDLESARQTFLCISDISESDVHVAQLLEKVEGIPLAITLLATQAQYVSCKSLVEQWHACKTSMVTRGWDSRLSSLDVSISLSLASVRFTNNAEALSLLQILSILPDGATGEELAAMTSSGFEVHKSLSTVLQVALAYIRAKDRICVLAPIRDYVQHKHPISLSLLGPVLSYHSTISRDATKADWKGEDIIEENKLRACIGNIHYVLHFCLNIPSLTQESIRAVLYASNIRKDSDVGSIELLLNESAKLARAYHLPQLEAQCRDMVGYKLTLFSLDVKQRRSAEQYLTESETFLRGLVGASEQLIHNQRQLAKIARMEGRLQESIQFAEKAAGMITESTSPATSALAYITLGRLLTRSGDFVRAAATMKLADTCYDPDVYPGLALLHSDTLCRSYLERCMHAHAIDVANIDFKAVGLYRNWRHAGILECRGYAYMSIGRYEVARKDLRESIDIFASSARETSMVESVVWIGFINVACRDFQAASSSFHLAYRCGLEAMSLELYLAVLDLFQGYLENTLTRCAIVAVENDGMMAINQKRDRALLRCQVYVRQGDVLNAITETVLAVVIARKLRDKRMIAPGILCLGDAYFFIGKDVATAKACYLAVLDWAKCTGMRRHIANALMRIGVTDHLQGDSASALIQLNEAARLYTETEGQFWAEFCEDRMHMIRNETVEENMPFFPPVCIIGGF